MNINLNLPQETQSLLFNFAKEQNTTAESVIQDAIIEFVEELKDLKLAQQAHDEYVASGRKSVSADELYKELGL